MLHKVSQVLFTVCDLTDELITEANNILLIDEWIPLYRNPINFKEENRLMMILLKLQKNRGSQFVTLGMDIITADLEHEIPLERLGAEARYLRDFAEGDEQLTKMANDFLEDNGFNKEK